MVLSNIVDNLVLSCSLNYILYRIELLQHSGSRAWFSIVCGTM